MRKTLAAVLLMAACAPVPPAVTMGTSPSGLLPVAAPVGALPITAASRLPAQRSNAEMAQDFLDLEFHMESGRGLPRLTRFEGPITIGFAGAAPATASADLAALVARLRAEAGIDLRLVPPGQPARITIAFSTRSELRQFVPSAACFVVPGVASLAEYRARRGNADLDWTQMTTRSRAGVFIPADTSPQEIRDCLHEEIAQALGPLNDLYRLPDTVFNDDNFQSVLTGFDMLMLRAHYAPELASGMTEAEVAARLPALLARLNPAGASGPAPVSAVTPRAWLQALDQALASGQTSAPARLAAARRSMDMAEAQGWQDSRMGFAWFVLARSLTPSDPAAAESAYGRAWDIYSRLPDGGIHAAHVAMQLAAMNLGLGQFDVAQDWVNRAKSAVPVAENPALSATLRLIEAAIQDHAGNRAAATALRLDSRADARYGFGAPSAVAEREAEIAHLAAKGQAG
jgi:Protein of unknown function (DUF2927)